MPTNPRLRTTWDRVRLAVGASTAFLQTLILAASAHVLGTLRGWFIKDAPYKGGWSTMIPTFWWHTLYLTCYHFCLGVRTSWRGVRVRPHLEKGMILLASFHPSRLGFIPYYRFLARYLDPNILVSLDKDNRKGAFGFFIGEPLFKLGRGLFFDRRPGFREATLKDMRQELSRRLHRVMGYSLFLNSRAMNWKTAKSKAELLDKGPWLDPEGRPDDLSWLIVPIPKTGALIDSLQVLPEDSRIVFVMSAFDIHVEGFRDLPRILDRTYIVRTIEIDPAERSDWRKRSDEPYEDYVARIRQWSMYRIWKPWCEELAQEWDANDPGWRDVA